MRWILSILSFIRLLFQCTAAASTPQTTTPPSPKHSEYQAWHPEPDGRGSYSIIFSCLTTLLFVASKILKPNILPSRWRGRFIQLAQIFVGMFVPEIVYLMALGQFCDAKGIRDTVNRKAKALAENRGIQVQSSLSRVSLIKRLWRWVIFDQEPQYIRLVYMTLLLSFSETRWN